jgi:hypothetical protein
MGEPGINVKMHLVSLAKLIQFLRAALQLVEGI